MRDRVPAKPGRMLLKRENGTQEYVTLTRADEPTQEGTPLNAASLFSAQTAAKYPAGIETVNDALGVLGAAPVYEETSVPIYLSSLTDGTSFQMKENGIDVEFVKLADNYEGSGRVAVMRKLPLGSIAWGTGSSSAYAGGTLDNWLNNTYLNTLDDRAQIVDTSIKVYSGSTRSTSVTTISRKIFAPSLVEFYNSSSSDGSNILALHNAITSDPDSQRYKWLRTPHTNADYANAVIYQGAQTTYKTNLYSVSPMFTLPPNYVTGQELVPTLKTVLGEDVKWGVKIETGSYMGTGTYGASNPNTLNFEISPKFIRIYKSSYSPSYNDSFSGSLADFMFGADDVQVREESGSHLICQISGRQLTWYDANSKPGNQLNSSGVTYYYFAIG